MLFRTLSKKSRKRWALLASTGVMFQLIPFGCGQNILHLVSPILLDGTNNFLDRVLAVIAPLVLPG